MRYVRLSAKTCWDSGELGLVLKDLPPDLSFSVAHSGTLIAHDIIEHQRGIKNIGTIWDEVIAFGAIWYTRGQFGEVNSNHRSPEEATGWEIGDFCVADDLGPYTGSQFEKLSLKRHEADDYSELGYIAEAAVKYIRKHASEEYDERCLTYMKPLLARGFQMANRKYRCPLKANNLFKQIQRVLDDFFKHPDEYFFEGTEYILGYSEYQAMLRPIAEDSGY